MINVGGVGAATGIGGLDAARLDAGALAAGVLNEVGGRVATVVDAVSGRSGGGLSASDQAELTRGGDIYGLGRIAREVGSQLGGSPVEQGHLERALAGYAAAAVVQVAGLHGATSDRQLAGLNAAVTAGIDTPGAGLGGVIGRIEAATAVLAAANG